MQIGIVFDQRQPTTAFVWWTVVSMVLWYVWYIVRIYNKTPTATKMPPLMWLLHSKKSLPILLLHVCVCVSWKIECKHNVKYLCIWKTMRYKMQQIAFQTTCGYRINRYSVLSPYFSLGLLFRWWWWCCCCLSSDETEAEIEESEKRKRRTQTNRQNRCCGRVAQQPTSSFKCTATMIQNKNKAKSIETQWNPCRNWPTSEISFEIKWPNKHKVVTRIDKKKLMFMSRKLNTVSGRCFFSYKET